MGESYGVEIAEYEKKDEMTYVLPATPAASGMTFAFAKGTSARQRNEAMDVGDTSRVARRAMSLRTLRCAFCDTLSSSDCTLEVECDDTFFPLISRMRSPTNTSLSRSTGPSGTIRDTMHGVALPLCSSKP